MFNAAGKSGERLTILFLTAWYPHVSNPAEGIFIREHARAVGRFHDVIVVHLRKTTRRIAGGWMVEQEQDPELHADIPTFRVLYNRLPLPKSSVLSSILAVGRAGRHLRRLGIRPDLIHAHIFTAGLPAVTLGRLLRVPVVITEHSSAFHRKLLTPEEKLSARLAFRFAQAVLPVSRALQRDLEEARISARFQVVPNAVDLSLFYPPPEGQQPGTVFRLLFAGSLLPVKGLSDLLAALADLQRERQDWQLDVVGDGPQAGELRDLAVQYELEEQVCFHGFQPKARLAEFMRSAHLFVLPSRYETFSCALVEAMASGLPVVATETGAIPDLVGKTGVWLVPPGDPVRLRLAIKEAMGQARSCDRRLIARSAHPYSLEAVGEQLHTLYTSVLSGSLP